MPLAEIIRQHAVAAVAAGEVDSRHGEHAIKAALEHGVLDYGDGLLVNPKGYKGAHFATWPEHLLDRIVRSMCPPRVCRQCGHTPQPETRPVPGSDYEAALGSDMYGDDTRDRAERRARGRTRRGRGNPRVSATLETTGWTDCGHNDYRAGTVLDPFAGTGTTLAVAVGLGRDAIGIDLDPDNKALARERLGVWLHEGPCR